MATSTSGISFGKIDTSGGSPRLTGSTSGIDTEALVTALSTAKRQPAVRLEQRITQNDAKVAALKELRSGLSELQGAVAKLRAPPGTTGAANNVFEAKEAFFSSSTTSTPSSIVGVGTSAAAAVGSYSIVVERLASAAKIASSSATDSSADLSIVLNSGNAFEGSFSIGLAGGSKQTIAVSGSDSLLDLRQRINDTSATTGVSASVLRVSATESRLVLTATETGKNIDLAAVSGDDVLGITGLSTDAGATAANPIQQAATSRIIFDGVAVERTGNRLSDVADGLTIDLLKAEPGTTITLDIERSLSAIKDSIKSFVDAFNKVRDLIASQQAVSSSGEIDKNAVLFGSSLLRGVSNDLSADLASAVGGLASGSMSTLGELGLKFDQNNRLTINEQTLDAKLLADVEGVRSLFEFQSTTASTDLRILGRGGSLPSGSISIGITDANADGVPEAATINGVAAQVSGGRIQGPDGSDWAGWTFAWAGSGSTTIEMTATQGIADRLYGFLGGVTDETSGRIGREITQLEDGNETMRDEIDRIDTRITDYRARLIEQFNAMETALSLANSIMTQVKAQTDAWSSNG